MCSASTVIFAGGKQSGRGGCFGCPVVHTRESLEKAMKMIGFRDGVDMQRLSTEEMGKRAGQINLATYYTLEDSSKFGKTIPPCKSR
jgi:hypothetical protein